MAAVLTSWKSIAQYMGTGVRTVQRWTTERGFPVRGTGSGHKRLVIAMTEEIDEWVRSQSLHGSDMNHQSEPEETLQERIATLQSQIGSLRLHIDVMQMRREIDESQNQYKSSEDVLLRSARLLEMSALVQQERRDVLDRCRGMRGLRSDGTPLTLNLLNGLAEATNAHAGKNKQVGIHPAFLKHQSAASATSQPYASRPEEQGQSYPDGDSLHELSAHSAPPR